MAVPPLVTKDHVTKPTVLLADDDAAFLENVRTLLKPEFETLASVGNGQALVETAQELKPDLIITDVSMPTLSGFQAARRLKAIHPGLRILFLSVHEDAVFITEAKRIGARGYVLKRCADSCLLPAVREALRDGSFVSPVP
jgi:DNA-binding NarL/FixJ family response regulator